MLGTEMECVNVRQPMFSDIGKTDDLHLKSWKEKKNEECDWIISILVPPVPCENQFPCVIWLISLANPLPTQIITHTYHNTQGSKFRALHVAISVPCGTDSNMDLDCGCGSQKLEHLRVILQHSFNSVPNLPERYIL